ncbi:MAG: peptidase S10 [Bacteroidetes bacterium]|nr:peptidase S10 [Bacteroidota bacterium]MBS1757205.1 peptidase S10 [Bacteroidota bacterium]
MKFSKQLIVAGLAFAFTATHAQMRDRNNMQRPGSNGDSAMSAMKPDSKNSQKSVTHGSVTVEGKRINYQADAGTLVLKNTKGVPTISMSYVAYFKEGENINQRPVTFIYNGGPGSCTVWLHMGCWGPQKVNIQDMSRSSAPYSTVNNDYSLLDASDLVFIDAPGTGFGEIITKDKGGDGEPKDFYGIDEDGKAFTSFIVQFISEYNRWSSPKYLFGESYGTFRSAVLANSLQRENVSLNGIILLSQLLTYSNMTETTPGNPGTDLPFELILPSFAATAYYHHKLPTMPAKLEPFLKEVEQFAMTDYALALNKGADLDEASYNAIAEKLHNYTGLSVAYLKKANLRVIGPQFSQTLLGDADQITGRLDSRFAGDAIDPLSETAEYDPMDSYIGAAFTASINTYMRNDLKFGKDLQYKIRGNVQPWNFQRRGFIGFPNVMNDLASAMVQNPTMKVLLTGGYYDLGTPYFEGKYEMKHLPMPASLQKNIQYQYFESGHMVYLLPDALKKLHATVAKFINDSH